MQRLILMIPADVRAHDVARALGGADVAAAVFQRAETAAVGAAQDRGAAALLAASHMGAWHTPGASFDGIHAGGPLAVRQRLLAERPDERTVGALANDRHEAMLLGEAGADYLMFEHAATGETLAAWWQSLFEVPAVIAGPARAAAAMSATKAEFVAITDAFEAGDPAAIVANVSAALAKGA